MHPCVCTFKLLCTICANGHLSARQLFQTFCKAESPQKWVGARSGYERNVTRTASKCDASPCVSPRTSCRRLAANIARNAIVRHLAMGGLLHGRAANQFRYRKDLFNPWCALLPVFCACTERVPRRRNIQFSQVAARDTWHEHARAPVAR